jgi:type I restriction-modification system DNA methylase subunit
MSVKKWLAASLLLPGLSLVALPAVSQQQPQQSGQPSSDPVADAARRAREQQKNAPKPKKVYTDDDIKPATPSSDARAGAAQPGQPAGGSQTTDNGQGAAGKDDAETVWKKRFQEQHNKIATAEKELDILQRESEKAQVQYYNDPQKALREQFTRKDINDKNAKIDQKKHEIADLKKQLDDMEDELRKSGGDPGWARE